jgi:hypothetical protein
VNDFCCLYIVALDISDCLIDQSLGTRRFCFTFQQSSWATTCLHSHSSSPPPRDHRVFPTATPLVYLLAHASFNPLVSSPSKMSYSTYAPSIISRASSNSSSCSTPRVRFNPEPLGPTPAGQPDTTPPAPPPRGRSQTMPSRPALRTSQDHRSLSRSRSRSRSILRSASRDRTYDDRSRSRSRSRDRTYHNHDRSRSRSRSRSRDRRRSESRDRAYPSTNRNIHEYREKDLAYGRQTYYDDRNSKTSLLTGIATLAAAAILPGVITAKVSNAAHGGHTGHSSRGHVNEKRRHDSGRSGNARPKSYAAPSYVGGSAAKPMSYAAPSYVGGSTTRPMSYGGGYNGGYAGKDILGGAMRDLGYGSSSGKYISGGKQVVVRSSVAGNYGSSGNGRRDQVYARGW